MPYMCTFFGTLLPVTQKYERYLLEILYATSVSHHPKHDIRVIPLNSMEVCQYCT
jgi:hypothetical protein